MVSSRLRRVAHSSGDWLANRSKEKRARRGSSVPLVIATNIRDRANDCYGWCMSVTNLRSVPICVQTTAESSVRKLCTVTFCTAYTHTQSTCTYASEPTAYTVRYRCMCKCAYIMARNGKSMRDTMQVPVECGVPTVPRRRTATCKARVSTYAQ